MTELTSTVLLASPEACGYKSASGGGIAKTFRQEAPEIENGLKATSDEKPRLDLLYPSLHDSEEISEITGGYDGGVGTDDVMVVYDQYVTLAAYISAQFGYTAE
jgi:hypothetical protein